MNVLTITLEQHDALNALMATVPQPGKSSTVNIETALSTWLGVSTKEIKLKLTSVLGQKDQLEDGLREWVERNPFDSAMSFLGCRRSRSTRPRRDTIRASRPILMPFTTSRHVPRWAMLISSLPRSVAGLSRPWS